MKLHYRLPIKLLALLLLLALLTGAGLGLYGTILCGDAGAFGSSVDFFNSTMAYRACREYAYNIQSILSLYATDSRETISDRDFLDRMREQFSSENTNLRVVLESEYADRTLELDDLLHINGNRSPMGAEKLAGTEAFEIQVSGGIIGRWGNLDSRLAEQYQAMMDEWLAGQRRESENDFSGQYADYAEDDYRNGSYAYEEDGYNYGSHAYVESVEPELPDYVDYQIRAYFYVDTALPVHDSFWSAYRLFWTFQHYAYPVLGLFAVCALLALLVWIYLMCAAGHRPDTDKEVITLRFIDRIPYDLFLGFCTVVYAPLTVLMTELIRVNDDFEHGLFFIILITCCFAFSLLFALVTLSTAARWKSKTLLRNTITWRICAWLWRILSSGAGKVAERFQPREMSPQEEAQKQEQRAQKQEQRSQTMNKVGEGARTAFGALGGIFGAIGGLFTYAWRKVLSLFSILPMIWKGLVLLLGIAFINFFLLMMAFLNRDELLLIVPLLFDIAVLWGYLNVLREMVWLHNGAKNIAAGDLNYRIPADVMHWEFKAHAEALNAIRDGIDAAVEERVQAVEERIKSERMRNELLTNVSHDIKTPLTSIINYVGLLQKEPIEGEKAREYIEVLDRQSNRLKKLLEDLLEASKASTGNITVNAAPTSVGELLRQVTGEYAEKLSAARLEPIITLPAQDAMIFADGRLLWRVFDNLMANIVKYAMPQTRVYFDLHSDVSITVIALKNVSRERLNIAADELMERFVRGDTSRSTEGSGLGLSIAQSLTELMGGTFALMIDGDLFKVQISFPTLHDIPEAAGSETVENAPEPSFPVPVTPIRTMPAAAATETAPQRMPANNPPQKKKYTLKMAMMAKAAAEEAERAAAEAEAAATEAGKAAETEAEESAELAAEGANELATAETIHAADEAAEPAVFDAANPAASELAADEATSVPADPEAFETANATAAEPAADEATPALAEVRPETAKPETTET